MEHIESKKEKKEIVEKDVKKINEIIMNIDKADFEFVKGENTTSQKLLKEYRLEQIYEYMDLRTFKYYPDKKELKQYTAKTLNKIRQSESPEEKQHYKEILNWLKEERKQNIFENMFNEEILKKC